MRRLALVLGVIAAGPALAQAPAPSPAPAAPVAAAATQAPIKAAAAPTAKAAAPKSCMRLPLSDIAFGRDGTIAQTRMRLDEYATEEAKRRGFGGKPLAKSNETIDCEVYLVLPFLGTEYKCLITATFCTK